MSNKSPLPRLYIDIDGVLLANEYGLSEGAEEFIKYIAENFDVHWLTTHCMHCDATWAMEYVDRASEEDLMPYLSKFKPTSWGMSKTDAIDFSVPFHWYDDDCFTAEKAALIKNKALNSWFEVNLKEHPDQLVRELKYLKSVVASSGKTSATVNTMNTDMVLKTLEWKEDTGSMVFDCELNLAIHPADTQVITLLVPGVDGSLDGYNDKYLTIANNLVDKHGSAVVRMDNPFIASSYWQSNLRKTLEYIDANSHQISGRSCTELRVMAHSAGAAAIGQIAWEYPKIKKILLVNTVADLGKESIHEGLSKFEGTRVAIVHGDGDPAVKEAKQLHSSSPQAISELIIVENADHHFSGEKNLQKFIELPEQHLF